MTMDEPIPDRQGLPVLPNSGKLEHVQNPEPQSAALMQHTSPADLLPAQRALEATIIEVLRSVYDPEIPVNIYELGLIYQIDIDPQNHVKVKMTLTAPGCPVAGSLPVEVERKIEAIPQVAGAEVELVWDPPWDKSRMSEAAVMDLGLI